MKILQMFVLGILVAALGQAAWAQCPSTVGTWSTNDATMLGGRATEAWCGADGNPIQGGQPGNTQNALSWNGTVVGGQWAAWGMVVDANGAVLIEDTVDGSGNGIRTYSTDYTGGAFWLTEDHTWSDGVNSLTGVLNSYTVVARLTTQGGATVGVSSDINFTGDFTGCSGEEGCSIRFEILDAQLAWHPNFGGSMPINYPALLCGATTGEAFDVPNITGVITCGAVATDEMNWGSLKALYK